MKRRIVLWITSMTSACCHGFAPVASHYTSSTPRVLCMSTENDGAATTTRKVTLTEETTWRLRLALHNVPTKNGRNVGELFVMDVQFVPEDGYEPPQGHLLTVGTNTNADNNNSTETKGLTTSSGGSRSLKMRHASWKLSEDPNNRKDGLWIWGLFKEPQYPFLLLQLQTEEYDLPNETIQRRRQVEGEENSILPLKLYAQLSHRRNKTTGEVTLDGYAALTIRIMETVRVDPFGAASVDVYEEVRVGQLSLRPL